MNDQGGLHVDTQHCCLLAANCPGVDQDCSELPVVLYLVMNLLQTNPSNIRLDHACHTHTTPACLHLSALPSALGSQHYSCSHQ
jgi:hypothetical protein